MRLVYAHMQMLSLQMQLCQSRASGRCKSVAYVQYKVISACQSFANNSKCKECTKTQKYMEYTQTLEQHFQVQQKQCQSIVHTSFHSPKARPRLTFV